MRFKSTALFTFIAAGFAGAAAAVPLAVNNPSFESPGASPGNFPPPTGWAGGGFTERFADIGNPTGGDQANYAGIDNGTVSQDLGVPFLPNSTYTVNFLVGNRNGFQEGLTQYGLQSSTAPGADLGTIVSVNPEATLANGTFVEGPAYTFTTGAVAPSGNVVVFFRGALEPGFPDNRGIVDLARVSVDAVPEPASVGMFGLFGVAALARRRRGR
jgi:hypothetical protein